MKVALIGDVHANLPALDAVLADAQGKGVEAIWNVGDFVGYGAYPDEVVRRLKELHAVSIAGNYDRKALSMKEKKGKSPKGKVPEKWLAFRWAYDNLSKGSRKYLHSLPEVLRIEADGKSVLMVHGSPESEKEHLTPDTPEERLVELAGMANVNIVLCGHSHQPFKRKAGGVWFINTGSVGRPDDGDPRACYAVLQVGPGLFQVRHYRVAYDVDSAAQAIRERRLPEPFAQMILRGRSLDYILHARPEGAPLGEGEAA